MSRIINEVVAIDNYPTDSPFSFDDLVVDISLEFAIDDQVYVFTEDFLDDLSSAILNDNNASSQP